MPNYENNTFKIFRYLPRYILLVHLESITLKKSICCDMIFKWILHNISESSPTKHRPTNAVSVLFKIISVRPPGFGVPFLAHREGNVDDKGRRYTQATSAKRRKFFASKMCLLLCPMYTSFVPNSPISYLLDICSLYEPSGSEIEARAVENYQTVQFCVFLLSI